MVRHVDEKDMLILNALKQDASQSIAKLSQNTHLPTTTIHSRIKKLREDGIIKNYTINMDKGEIFGNIMAYILIKTFQANQREIIHTLMQNPKIEETAIITGDTDIIVKIRVHSISELDRFIIDELRNVPGIQESRTIISLENYDK